MSLTAIQNQGFHHFCQWQQQVECSIHKQHNRSLYSTYPRNENTQMKGEEFKPDHLLQPIKTRIKTKIKKHKINNLQ